jgi:APA family basic amino acid/polyamine antiporter
VNQTLGQKLTRTKPIAQAGEQAHGPAGSGLGRSIGLFPLTMIGVGATIGTGIFFTMVEAVPKAGPSVILSFLMAAITAGLTALCYAELSFRIPASGSSYSFAYATVGEFLAFIMAACLLLEYGLAASATAIGWSSYLNNFLGNAIGWQIPEMLRSPMIVSGANGIEFHTGHINLPPILLVCMCGFLLLRGTKESATTNAIMVLIKLAILIFFVVIAFSGFNADNFYYRGCRYRVFLFHRPRHRGDGGRRGAQSEAERPDRHPGGAADRHRVLYAGRCRGAGCAACPYV